MSSKRNSNSLTKLGEGQRLSNAHIDTERYLQGPLGQHGSNIEDARTKLARKDTLLQLFERNGVEEVIIDLISSKDKDSIRRLLQNEEYRATVNVHTKDLEGHSIIMKAVASKDLDILKIFLEFFGDELDFRDAMLACIKENQVEMVDEILKYEEDRESRGGRKVPFKALALKDHIVESSPFMVAAQLGNYEILQRLYEKGERLPQLHLPSCTCLMCKLETRQVETSLHRVYLLEAMANPIYVIFMAEQDGDFDPVFESFKLEKIVEKCLEEEPEFKEHYEHTLKCVRDLPKELLNLCRSMEETRIFLSPTLGYEGSQHQPYPRLAFAIDMDQKEFVASSNVQFVLQTDYIGYPWHTETSFEEFMKICYIVVMVVLFFPYNIFIWVALICCMKTTMVQYLISPVNRCFSKLGSYICFCTILIFLNGYDRSEGTIQPHVRYLRWIVVLYVTSHTVSLFRQLFFDPHVFFLRSWNRYDAMTLLLFWLTFAVWAWDYEVHFERARPRRTLSANDPLLIGECFFALATTFATLRIVRWYILFPKIGALQTAMGRMASNFKLIFIFFAWTTVTFALGTTILYRPYRNLKDTSVAQPLHVLDLESHFLTWFKVGKIGPDQMKLTVPREVVTDPNTGIQEEKENPQYTTQTFLTIICITFNVVGANFLRSTVTGLFGSTHKAVMKAKEVEWKYLRAQEWLYYLQDTTLAHPLNLLPHWLCFCKLVKGQVDEETLDTEQEQRRQYPHLLKRLFQRYLQKFRRKHIGQKTRFKVDRAESRIEFNDFDFDFI